MLVRLSLSEQHTGLLYERFWEWGVQGLKDCQRHKWVNIISRSVVAGISVVDWLALRSVFIKVSQSLSL